MSTVDSVSIVGDVISADGHKTFKVGSLSLKAAAHDSAKPNAAPLPNLAFSGLTCSRKIDESKVSRPERTAAARDAIDLVRVSGLAATSHHRPTRFRHDCSRRPKL
jgi:translation initiation factor 2B subunit (eIF-2B alpha/beta/delta family)